MVTKPAGAPMPDTPLNPDALHAASREVFREVLGFTKTQSTRVARRAVSAYLAAALPEVTSVEELDQLPVGTVIVINGTMLQAEDRDDYGTMWSRVRDIDAYPSDALALPARVLYRPEVKP